MEVYLHLQRAKHSFDNIKGVPSLRGLFNCDRLKTEEFETFACVFIQTPSPFGYSLLESKRESISLISNSR